MEKILYTWRILIQNEVLRNGTGVHDVETVCTMSRSITEALCMIFMTCVTAYGHFATVSSSISVLRDLRHQSKVSSTAL